MIGDLFLGLDLSTQSLTTLAFEPSSGVVYKDSINFDETYPSYETRGGVMVADGPGVVHADPRMWVGALDDALIRLKEKELSAHIRAVGVSAQQHGSVYLNKEAVPVLSRLDPSSPLSEQTRHVFSRPTSPLWMDSSTHKECLEITKTLGGNAAVSQLTGSIATERFAGPQIRKFWKEDSEGYMNTAHVALISSFITSLLTGRVAPVDAGDGFGTNLADIRAGNWSEKALNAAAPGLKSRLPQLITEDKFVGRVSPCLSDRHGLQPDTQVVVGSGDNPCTLVGLGLIGKPDMAAISLGTSDTYFGCMTELLNIERESGHIFGTADGSYMYLICFKNGSLAREEVKKNYRLSWDVFSQMLLETPPGNQGRIMLPYFMPEITPLVQEPGVRRFGGLAHDDAKANVRAIAEAQAMAMYRHSEWTGHRPSTILVTAGGSENKGLLRVIANVFNAQVRSFEVKESAALGAAVRAAHCYLNSKETSIDWSDLIDPFLKSGSASIVDPVAEEADVYRGDNELMDIHKACEAFALGKGEIPHEKIDAFKRRYAVNP